ncbi:MAG: xanthine dehydrogenase family protein molybdopterin-binding subunit [Chitinivorax sp.]
MSRAPANPSRRQFLLTASLAGGALLVGCATKPVATFIAGSEDKSVSEAQLNAWIRIARDGKVFLAMPRSEMGQGIHTALPLLVAEELGCRLDDIVLEDAPIDGEFANLTAASLMLPFRPDDKGVIVSMGRWTTDTVARTLKLIMTGGSTSVRDAWLPMRSAGATARELLKAAAAKQWGVAVDSLRVEDGKVIAADGRSAGFGELLDIAVTLTPPDKVALKQPGQFKLLGKPVPRKDLPPKVQGKAVYGIDVKLPNMLIATLRMNPELGGKVGSFDASAAAKAAGVHKVVELPALNGATAGVAVIADSYWQAKQAVDSIDIKWQSGPLASIDNHAIYAYLQQELAQSSGFAYHKAGDSKREPADGDRVLRATFRAPLLAHATMEPMNTTALVTDDGVEVWSPTQMQGFAAKVAASVAGVSGSKVKLHTTLLGGGFGRRLDVDFIAQAVFLAKQMPGRPVKLIWSRQEDTCHDFYRPAAVAEYSAHLDSRGRLQYLALKSASPSIGHQQMNRLGLPGVGPDKTMVEGGYDLPYQVPNMRFAGVLADIGVPVGYWRSVGHSFQAFFLEAWIDELAHAAGRDSAEFRLALLQDQPRHRAVLQLALDKANYGKQPLPAGHAHGIALAEAFGSIVAQVAEVSLNADKSIRVHRVVCAIDCGLVVQPDTVAQQIEGGVVFGLSAALYGDIDIKHGQVQQSSFSDYRLVKMAEAPKVETHIVASAEAPGGVGEPGVPPVAPALANALFKLTGQRLRSLPLKLA